STSEADFSKVLEVELVRGCLGALDVDAQTAQVGLEARIAAVDVVHVADLGDPVGAQAGDGQARPGADVRGGHRGAGQALLAADAGVVAVGAGGGPEAGDVV